MLFKKLLCGISTLTICVMLTGCCMSHEWKEATCTEPKTCTKCGETKGKALGHTWIDATCTAPKTCSTCNETEGEALGHNWTDATCTAPKTCSICSETEGEALGHNWIDANYQEPKTCSVCGETEGEPLTASFEEHGLSINVKEGVTYDYVTICNANTSLKTVGHFTISDYRIFEQDETHEAKEGYEWRACHASIAFDDKNAQNNGIKIRGGLENYYAIEDWYNSSSTVDENSDLLEYKVNYKGTEYSVYLSLNLEDLGWTNHINTWSFDCYVQVPVGYDGMVIGFWDAGIVREDGMYIYDVADENTLFFRMN